MTKEVAREEPRAGGGNVVVLTQYSPVDGRQARRLRGVSPAVRYSQVRVALRDTRDALTNPALTDAQYWRFVNQRRDLLAEKAELERVL